MSQRHPINIRLIDHVVIRARDPGLLLEFYRDVLGCRLEREQSDIGLYQLRAGNSLIDIIDVDSKLGRSFAEPPARHAPNMDHFCVQVEPWDAARILEHLRSHDVADVGDVVERYGALGAGPSVYLRDPEGNIVELKGPPAGG